MPADSMTETKVTSPAISLQSWETIRASKSLFASRQIHLSTTYAALRASVALFAMGVAWIMLTTRFHLVALPHFFNRTVTVRHLVLSLLVLGVWNLCFLWDFHPSSTPRDWVLQELRMIVLAAVVSASVVLLPQLGGAVYVVHPMVFFLLAGLLATLGCLLLAAAWVTFGNIAPRVASPRRCLIVGTGPRAMALRESLADAPGIYEIVGCIDDEYLGTDAGRDRYLGPIAILDELLRSHPIDTVLVGLPVKSCYDAMQEVIRIAESVGVEAHYPADVFSTDVAVRHVGRDQHRSLVVLRVTRHDERRHVKRAVDIVGALVLLVCAAPVLLAAFAAILITDPGPLFFVQERYGQHRRRFRMYKLRTMVTNAEALQAALESKNEVGGPVFKIKRDPRITPVGALLRKTSIDELPQLINVLRGEMSLVGPRPLPVRDVQKFEEAWLLRRFSVRPGLTCLWQVSGRSNTTFDFWIRQDLSYIDNWSLGLDLKILAKTVATVLRGSGAM